MCVVNSWGGGKTAVSPNLAPSNHTPSHHTKLISKYLAQKYLAQKYSTKLYIAKVTVDHLATLLSSNSKWNGETIAATPSWRMQIIGKKIFNNIWSKITVQKGLLIMLTNIYIWPYETAWRSLKIWILSNRSPYSYMSPCYVGDKSVTKFGDSPKFSPNLVKVLSPIKVTHWNFHYIWWYFSHLKNYEF